MLGADRYYSFSDRGLVKDYINIGSVQLIRSRSSRGEKAGGQLIAVPRLVHGGHTIPQNSRAGVSSRYSV